MNDKIIVNIENIVEDKDSYYIATTESIPWLMVEGNTLDEIINLFPQVANDFLEERNKRIKNKFLLKKHNIFLAFSMLMKGDLKNA